MYLVIHGTHIKLIAKNISTNFTELKLNLKITFHKESFTEIEMTNEKG